MLVVPNVSSNAVVSNLLASLQLAELAEEHPSAGGYLMKLAEERRSAFSAKYQARLDRAARPASGGHTYPGPYGEELWSFE